MAIEIPETPSARPVKPTREQALGIAERRMAARRWRTRRLRHVIAVFSIAAFIGPFGVIYTQLASGRDPVLSSTQTAATAQSGATASAASAAAQTNQITSPAAVTTQQS